LLPQKIYTTDAIMPRARCLLERVLGQGNLPRGICAGEKDVNSSGYLRTPPHTRLEGSAKKGAMGEDTYFLNEERKKSSTGAKMPAPFE
jgi:hypothetical protein